MSILKAFSTLEYYETEINAIKQELSRLPAGTLVKRGAYYCVKDGTSEKGITRDRQKVRQLARKAYLTLRLSNLKWNYSLAVKLFKQLKAEDPVKIIDKLPSAHQSLPIDCFFHPSKQQLQERSSLSDDGNLDGLVYLTNSGIRVRSKSERTIANILDQYKVPYQFDAVLTLGGKVRYPDFSVFRPFDGKLIIWEHFGLMDHEDYRQNAIRKLSLYAKNGFIPFDNLICTYEHDLHDPSRIEYLVKMFFSG